METEKLHKHTKRTLIFVALWCFFGGCLRELPPGEHNNFHPYGVSHVALHFEYFGDVRGTEDVFVDSFGTREAQDNHSELITDKGFQPTENYTVREFGHVTLVDSVKGVALKVIDRGMDSIFRLRPPDIPTYQAQTQIAYAARGYERAGDTLIGALRAHVWRHTGDPDYILEWRGLMIGSKDVVLGHDHELRLLSIDTTDPVDPSRFVPPSGFPVRDLTHLKPGEMPPPPNP